MVKLQPLRFCSLAGTFQRNEALHLHKKTQLYCRMAKNSGMSGPLSKEVVLYYGSSTRLRYHWCVGHKLLPNNKKKGCVSCKGWCWPTSSWMGGLIFLGIFEILQCYRKNTLWRITSIACGTWCRPGSKMDLSTEHDKSERLLSQLSFCHQALVINYITVTRPRDRLCVVVWCGRYGFWVE